MSAQELGRPAEPASEVWRDTLNRRVASIQTRYMAERMDVLAELNEGEMKSAKLQMESHRRTARLLRELAEEQEA